MKKTIVGIMTIVAMLVAILGTNVNAAEMSVPTEVKAGENVTVTISVPTDTSRYNLKLAYNTDLLEYVTTKSGDLAPEVGNRNGVLSLAAASTSQTVNTGKIEMTFKAKADITENKEANFEVTEFKANGTTETLPAVKTTIVVEAAEPTPTPEVPDVTDTPAPTGTQTPAPTGTTKPSDDGKVKYPQTGAPVYAYVAGIALVAIVAGAVVAVRKNK